MHDNAQALNVQTIEMIAILTPERNCKVVLYLLFGWNIRETKRTVGGLLG